MKHATLKRISTSDEGTFGLLTLDGLIFTSGELPERDNRPGESCIPPGVYQCKWLPSPKFSRNVYHVQDVPGRTVIEIHSGNYCGAKPLRSDVDGCILLGTKREVLNGQMAVVESRKAVQEFEDYAAGDDIELTVAEDYADHPFS